MKVSEAVEREAPKVRVPLRQLSDKEVEPTCDRTRDRAERVGTRRGPCKDYKPIFAYWNFRLNAATSGADSLNHSLFSARFSAK